RAGPPAEAAGAPPPAGASGGGPGKGVPPADHHGDLTAELHALADLRRDAPEDLRLDAVALAARERLTRQLEQDSPIGCRRPGLGHRPTGDRGSGLAD